MSDWGFDAPVNEAPQPMRPISIDEFPPLPPPEERYATETELEPEVSPTANSSYGPPRLSAEEEAALIAELQRYVQPETIETGEDAMADSLPGPDALATEDFAWSKTAYEVESFEESPVPSFEVVETPFASVAGDEEPLEPAPDIEPWLAELGESEEASLVEDAEEKPSPKIVQIEGRVYEEPAPRHWPSVPLSSDEEDALKAEPEPARWPKAAGDWEPL
jgi:hypothetical protein